MHIQINVNTEIEINDLTDLPKLKLLMESSHMKINKSQLAREYGVDRRTIENYLNGYIKTSTRNKPSKIDKFYDEIKSLLSEDSIQRFYYKRVLWQYLKDNHGLDCSASNFRAYISKKPEFQSYFDANSGKITNGNKAVVRYETPPAEQAQLDWKEDIKYITRDDEVIHVNVLVLTLSFSRLKVYQISLSKSQTILLTFLTEAFEVIGGVPEKLLVDNMKTIMYESRTQYINRRISVRI